MKERKFYVLCAALVSALSFVHSGCVFFLETEEITVSIPDAGMWGDESGVLRTISAEGDFVECKFSCRGENSLSVPPGRTFTVAKNTATPFTLTSSEGFSLGFIYPYSVTPCKEDYFAADILLTMYRASLSGREETMRYLSCFNWERFMKECREVEDHALLDRQLIMESIANGSFKKTYLKPRKT